LTAGPFQCRFSGFIKLGLSDTYRFRMVGNGKAMLKINGQSLLDQSILTASGTDSPPLLLRGGLNQVEVDYQSPPAGAAQFRLLWSTAQFAWESVPPTVLVHEGDQPALATAQNLRDARFLTSAMFCSRCHQPSSPWPSNAMPELQLEAPALDNCGNQFQIQWMLSWLKSPFEVVSEAIMPKCLKGDADQMRLEARDVTAFLASLKTATNQVAETDATAAASPALIKAGEAQFTRMGCVACHLFANDKRLDGDTRRSLAHVRSKWQPRALAEFLMEPEKNWKWVRMPNFQFTREEAEGLAAYVLSRCTERFARDPMGPPKGPVPNTASELGGDLANGAKLVALRGCANCHQIPGITRRTDYAVLEKVLRPQSAGGCLATDRDTRRTAPDFNLTSAQTATLAQILHQVPFASLRQDSASEFSSRQFEALRCSSCHERESAKDLWFQLESLAAAKNGSKPVDEEESLYTEKTIHAQRPHLTWTGEKLRPEWMEAFLSGKIAYKPRRKLPARMPSFPAYARGLAVGFAQEHGMEANSPAPGPLREDLVPIGKALTLKGALSCVDCHDTGRDFALAGGDTATMNFAYVPDRLRRTYFDRYLQDPQRLLPGTMMPKFITDQGTTGVSAYYDGNARQQFEAIWNYMRSLKP
jgi:mono/diheme cytochrome c family protein